MSLTFKDRVIDILGSDGVISCALENYESRPQQLKMSEAICDSIENEKHLLVEAGTGVGKSPMFQGFSPKKKKKSEGKLLT